MPLITTDIEESVYDHIRNELFRFECPLKIMNGMPDHVHTLFRLSPKYALANVIKHIKGGSSEYINQNELTTRRFAWQTGYCAYSASESLVDKVYNYILRQKQHHQRQDFDTEFKRFIDKHGLQMDK